MKFLIVGLGNIGPEYLFTRHNIGFMAVDKIANNFETKFSMERLAYYSEIKYKGKQIHLIKPTTYMNLSGKAVNYWLKELKIEKENMIVISDEIALPFAKLRIKPKGSHAGHNGLRNIDEVLGGNEFARLRCGVGDDFSKGRQAEYVLSEFNTKEMEEIPEFLDKIAEAVINFCLEGISQTMNKYNQ
jgi:peptidyl-tRNA hydrolase, PTH1 family